jgi:hypothetical protein
MEFSFKQWLEDTGEVSAERNGAGAYAEIPSKYQTQEMPLKKKRLLLDKEKKKS